MAITNASRVADFGSGIGTVGAVFQVDNTNERIGIGTTNPQAMLQVGTAVTVYGNSGIVSATSFYGSGIVSATSFYGDGSNLSNIISGVGVNSGGTNIGYGVTTLNFVGSGTTIEVSGSTANISAGGGGGAIGTTGITTQTIFSNPNTISEDQMLTVSGSNYGMFGPVTVGAAITVGVGNTFVVV